jgi:hypothetical protein
MGPANGAGHKKRADPTEGARLLKKISRKEEPKTSLGLAASILRNARGPELTHATRIAKRHAADRHPFYCADYAQSRFG